MQLQHCHIVLVEEDSANSTTLSDYPCSIHKCGRKSREIVCIVYSVRINLSFVTNTFR